MGVCCTKTAVSEKWYFLGNESFLTKMSFCTILVHLRDGFSEKKCGAGFVSMLPFDQLVVFTCQSQNFQKNLTSQTDLRTFILLSIQL